MKQQSSAAAGEQMARDRVLYNNKEKPALIPSLNKKTFDVKVVLRRIFLGEIEHLLGKGKKSKSKGVNSHLNGNNSQCRKRTRKPLKEVTKQATPPPAPKLKKTIEKCNLPLPPIEPYRSRTRFGFFRIPPPLKKPTIAKKALPANTSKAVSKKFSRHLKKLPQKNKKPDSTGNNKTRKQLPTIVKSSTTANHKHHLRKIKEIIRGRGRPRINRDDNKSPKQTLIAKKPSTIKRIRT